MEQIETQASDLRFLATAPVPLSNSPSISYETPRPGTHASPAGSASFGDNSASQGDGGASANKRKSIDDGGASAKQTRSKRNRVSLRLLLFGGFLWLRFEVRRMSEIIIIVVIVSFSFCYSRLHLLSHQSLHLSLNSG